MTSDSGLALALTLLAAHDPVAAENTIRDYLAANPGDSNAFNILGVLCKQAGRMSEARDALKRAVELEKRHVPAWINLSRTQELLGDLPEALEALTAALQIAPADPEVLAQLGWIQHRLGAHAPAEDACRRALAVDADSVTAHANLGLILLDRGRHAEAILELKRATELDPSRIPAWSGLELALMRAHRFAEAIPVLECLANLCPGDAKILMQLGDAFAELDELPRANEAYRAAIKADPDDLEPLGKLCFSLLATRHDDEASRIEEAVKLAYVALDSGQDTAPIFFALQAVLERVADFEGLARLGNPFLAARSNPHTAPFGLFSRVKTRDDRYRLIELHRDWGLRVSESLSDRTVMSPRIRKRNKLRIGLVSSDLRSHPISYFVLPLIQHYDRTSIELYCYSCFPGPSDDIQTLITNTVDQFRLLPERTDEEIAHIIAADEPDSIFELGGITKFNRLRLMGYRMAPSQVSWLGYPHSTGLPNIDRVLVDPYIKPSDSRLLLELPLEMPDSWVSFGPYGFFEIPIEQEPPAARSGGRITFGTMNNPSKFTPSCIATWATVLKRVEHSRFLIVRPDAQLRLFQRNIAREFSRNGIAENRLSFLSNERGHHLTLYNEIDIALDTFPQTGGTTTCESLWMGVPVVSLVGPAFFERLSLSNLSNAGLGELCSETPEGYIERAVILARDLTRLRALRRELRDQLRRSPLCLTERWVRNFETAARGLTQN